MSIKESKKTIKLKQIRDILEAEVLCGNDYLDKKIEMVAASDLLSDVLAFVKSDSLLLTGLINPQVVRTGEMAEVAAICFVRGKQPQEETIKLANDKKIPLLITKLFMYESCGRLYREGLSGGYDSK